MEVFLYLKKNIFSYLKDDFSILERDPLETLSNEGNLAAYKHNGFWQCMDTSKRQRSFRRIF